MASIMWSNTSTMGQTSSKDHQEESGEGTATDPRQYGHSSMLPEDKSHSESSHDLSRAWKASGDATEGRDLADSFMKQEPKEQASPARSEEREIVDLARKEESNGHVSNTGSEEGSNLEDSTKENAREHASGGDIEDGEIVDEPAHEHVSGDRVEEKAVLDGATEEDGKKHALEDDQEATKGGVQSERWEEMFNRLLAYKEEHGDCLVPHRYEPDPQLGTWVSTQRRHYKILMARNGTSPMTMEKARRLEEVGFQWSTRDPRHVPWEYRYRQLVEFRKKYGHAQVPIGWEENVQLSNWVSTQRQEFKLIQRGRQSRLTEQKINLLNKVDFVWEAQRGGPRRKRRATVAVPPKANPVHGVGPRPAKRRHLSSKGAIGPSSLASPPAVRSSSSIVIPGLQSLTAASAGSLLGTTNQLLQTVPAGVLGATPQAVISNPWQVLSNGAYQQTLVVPGGNTSLFPIATQLPVATASGIQLGVVPVVTQITPQQLAAARISAAYGAAAANQQERARQAVAGAIRNRALSLEGRYAPSSAHFDARHAAGLDQDESDQEVYFDAERR